MSISFLSLKCSLLFTSAANIQVHFRLDFIMYANKYFILSLKYCLLFTSAANVQVHFRLDFIM